MRSFPFFIYAAVALGAIIWGASAGASVGAEWFLFSKEKRAAIQAEDLQNWQEGVCISEILAAERRYGIPSNYLLAIGLQETGRRGTDGKLVIWPWTVNAAGIGKWFDTKEEALKWAETKRRSGIRSIDLGCMQINQRWHPDAFASYEDGFSPEKNVDYAARLLVDLRKRTGSWEKAAGSYHSFTHKPRTIYIKKLQGKKSYIEKNAAYYAGFSDLKVTTASAGHVQTGRNSLFATQGKSDGVRQLFSIDKNRGN